MIPTPEREQQFAFPADSYFIRADYPLFIRADTQNRSYQSQPLEIVLKNFKDNGRYGIGAPLGYVAEAELSRLGLLSSFQYTPSRGLTMVAKRKLDAYVLERRIGQTLLRQLNLNKDVAATEANLISADWQVAFNKRFYQRHRSLVEQFWRELNTKD